MPHSVTPCNHAQWGVRTILRLDNAQAVQGGFTFQAVNISFWVLFILQRYWCQIEITAAPGTIGSAIDIPKAGDKHSIYKDTTRSPKPHAPLVTVMPSQVFSGKCHTRIGSEG